MNVAKMLLVNFLLTVFCHLTILSVAEEDKRRSSLCPDGWVEAIYMDMGRLIYLDLVIFKSSTVFQGCILINSDSHRGMTFGDALEFCEGLDPTARHLEIYAEDQLDFINVLLSILIKVTDKELFI